MVSGFGFRVQSIVFRVRGLGFRSLDCGIGEIDVLDSESVGRCRQLLF